jgi:hypothetical protein
MTLNLYVQTPVDHVPAPTLTSEWGALNPRLIGSLFAVNPSVTDKGHRHWITDTSQPLVKFAVSDCTLEAQMQRSSPFEAIGLGHAAPLLTAALQTNMVGTVLNAVSAVVPSETIAGLAAELGTPKQAMNALQNLYGASSITKLNSELVFDGASPLKWTLVATCRAWKDPKREVEDPINALMGYALPQSLSDQGFVENGISGKSFLRSLFPSEAPKILGFTYGGMSISPCVIESITQPLSSPMDADGNRLNVSVQLAMSTLGAIDKGDWNRIVS